MTERTVKATVDAANATSESTSRDQATPFGLLHALPVMPLVSRSAWRDGARGPPLRLGWGASEMEGACTCSLVQGGSAPAP